MWAFHTREQVIALPLQSGRRGRYTDVPGPAVLLTVRTPEVTSGAQAGVVLTKGLLLFNLSVSACLCWVTTCLMWFDSWAVYFFGN